MSAHYMVYSLQKDTSTDEVRIGQTARLRERLRDHYREELREWRLTSGPMLFLRRARLLITATTDDRAEALRCERQAQERAGVAGLRLVTDATGGQFLKLPRKLDGTGRRPREERPQVTLPMGAVLHAAELQELLKDQRRVRGDETRRRVLCVLQAIPTDDQVSKKTLAQRAGVSLDQVKRILKEIEMTKTTTGRDHKAEYVPGESVTVDARVKQFAAEQLAKLDTERAEAEDDVTEGAKQRRAEDDVLRVRKTTDGQTVVDAEQVTTPSPEELWEQLSGQRDELTARWHAWDASKSVDNRRAYIEALERATDADTTRTARKLSNMGAPRPRATPKLQRKW